MFRGWWWCSRRHFSSVSRAGVRLIRKVAYHTPVCLSQASRSKWTQHNKSSVIRKAWACDTSAATLLASLPHWIFSHQGAKANCLLGRHLLTFSKGHHCALGVLNSKHFGTWLYKHGGALTQNAIGVKGLRLASSTPAERLFKDQSASFAAMRWLVSKYFSCSHFPDTQDASKKFWFS